MKRDKTPVLVFYRGAPDNDSAEACCTIIAHADVSRCR
jgi:hypothetical protein